MTETEMSSTLLCRLATQKQMKMVALFFGCVNILKVWLYRESIFSFLDAVRSA
jgi:hypothetical protein